MTDKVLSKFEESQASNSEQEQELLRALLCKYADHRGTGENSKWTVLLSEFNKRADANSQKSEASLKRMSKKFTQQVQEMEDKLVKFAQTPASTPEDEQEVLKILMRKYAEHRGDGENAKYAVIGREFNARVVESMQKQSEASLKRAVKKLGVQPGELLPFPTTAPRAAAGEKKEETETAEKKEEPVPTDEASADKVEEAETANNETAGGA